MPQKKPCSNYQGPHKKGPQPEVRLMWPGLLSASELKAEVHTLLAFG